MSTKLLLRSFAGGEVGPELAGRLDLVKYQTGLSLARNFITLPHGPATRRTGLQFVNEAKDSTQAVRIMPFTFSASQTAVLEFGDQYVRVHTNGGTLLEDAKACTVSGATVTCTAHGFAVGDWVFLGGRYLKVSAVTTDTFTVTDMAGASVNPAGTTVARVFTLATPYLAADLFDIHFRQSADVITLTHPSYAARELARVSATSWTLTEVSFAPPTEAPTGVAVSATIPQNQNLSPQKYVVTAVSPDGVTESLPSAPVSVNNNLSLAGNFNTITWNPIDGAPRYNVYKLRGGTYGYIGQATPTGGSSKTISTAVRNGSKTVTVTTTTAHGYSVGTLVFIAGARAFNGVWAVTEVTSSTVFKFRSNGDSRVVSTGGTVSTPSLSVVDDNVLADTTQSPPDDIIKLNIGGGDYPSTSVYHEQRRWFAGTDGKPQVVWGTRTGAESNLTSSIPSRADDGMEVRVASGQYNKILHLVALSDLIALTAGGEFRIYAEGAPAITPTSITIKPQGYSGASNVQPVTTTGSLLYVQAQGSRIRELAYSWETNVYKSTDTSIMAPHRFNGFTITDLAYSRAPDSILWAVRNDGTLLGMTYLPDQQVFGWHAHDTDGAFESVAVVAENNEDVLYAVVRRTIGARTVRYIERMRTRTLVDPADAFFVDSGLAYSGTPVTTVTGLWHLNGKTVDILANGAVLPRQTVTNGTVTLATAAAKVTVGLPVTADLRTLPLAIEGAQAAGQGTLKNVSRVHLRVSQSGVVKAGPSFSRLREYPARAVSDPYGSAPALRDGELSLSVDPSWNTDAAICVRQDQPLPLTVLSMTLEVQTGG